MFLKRWSEVSFHHCPKNANQVAHELAKFAYSSKETHVWDGDPPDFILSYGIRDVSLLSVQLTLLSVKQKHQVAFL
jgi:hypothetical protein